MAAVGTRETSLVVLRGNSGSGKSTIAGLIRAAAPEVAIVSQDVLRRDVLGASDVDGNPAIGLIDLVARHALDAGRSVVVEGILNAARYGPMLRNLVADHRGLSRAFVLDVPFDETVRRHATRAKSEEFTDVEMRAWWHGLQLVDGLDETVLPVGRSADELAASLVRDCRL